MLPANEKIAALRVERRELASLKPHPRNPRTHPKAGSPAWEALKRSLGHDYFDPLVVNLRNDTLVSGHLRHKVLLESGFTHADVSLVDYDEVTHIARMIAANSLLGAWEEDVTDDTGDATVLVSQAEEVARKWQVAPGDIYAAGQQRILCGDCTSAENWRALLGERRADLVWTDPPYNVDYDSIQQRRVDLARSEGKTPHAKPEAILNDDLTEAQYGRLLATSFATAFAFARPGAAIYVAHADSYGLLTRQAVAAAGFHVAQCLIWVKNAFTLGRQDYQWQHEPILYGWKPGAGHYWQGGYSQASVLDDEEKHLDRLGKPALIALIQRLRNDRDTTVIREPRGTGGALHPTVKPLPLVARQIWNSSHRGDTVLELFGGSGTTLLAAEQTGRRGVATELDPKFCAVILERLTRAGLTVEKLRDGPAKTSPSP